ncbi:MAG: XRE family transcriptional regulator, partial [Nocardioides sp.]
MAGGNVLLRGLREGVESSSAPGERMGRQELADRVNDYVEERTGRPGALDANYVGKLERGVISWPRDHYRAGFRAVLGVGTDRELGFSRPVSRMAVGGGNATELHGVIPRYSTQRVARQHVDAVRAAAEMFTGVDHGHGGGDVAVVAAVHLQHAVALLDLPCRASLRSDLFTAVGWLGNVVAFAEFDAARHPQASTAFTFALRCAEQAGDWNLRAKALSGMAREAIWRGDPDSGLTCVELAMVRADRLTCTERAMLLTARARALALMGRNEEASRCVHAADEQFNRRVPGEDPPWMAYYDEAQHLGDTGHALADVAVCGGYVMEAGRRLGAAVALHGPAFARSRGMSGLKLATLAL